MLKEVTLIGCTVRDAIINRSSTSPKQRKRLVSCNFSHFQASAFLERHKNKVCNNVFSSVDSVTFFSLNYFTMEWFFA